MYLYTTEITEPLEELERDRKKYRNKNILWRFLKACSLTFIILGGTYGYFPYSFLGFIPLIITTIKSEEVQGDYDLILLKIEKVKGEI